MDTELSQVEQQRTACAVVGGGPGGAMLALLLARQGVDVTLLERGADFDRDFRGDTLQVSVLELLAELGVLERLLELPHSKIHRFTVRTNEGERLMADFSKIKSPYPYIVTMPQASFLDFIVSEAGRYPNFHLVMDANVQELIEQNGVVQGVRYQRLGSSHELYAELTVGADGRNSKVRRQAGLELIKIAAPLDVLWFRLPRSSADEQMPLVYASRGQHINVIARPDSWQIGYAIPKGGYHELRKAGIDALRQSLSKVMPDFAERLNSLTDWHQISFLAVESARMKRWHKPGVILIGDAAHVLSPFVGAGINFAIQDAVAVSNQVGEKLQSGKVSVNDLAAIQRQRRWAVRIVQWLDAMTQHGIQGQNQDAAHRAQRPHFAQLPFTSGILTRYVAYGIGRVRLKERGNTLQLPAPTSLNTHAAPAHVSTDNFNRHWHSEAMQNVHSDIEASSISWPLRLHNIIQQSKLNGGLRHGGILLLAALVIFILRLTHNSAGRLARVNVPSVPASNRQP